MLAFGEAAEHAAPLGFWDTDPRILHGDINFLASREHGQGNSSLPMVQRIADKVAQGFIEIRNIHRSRYLGIDGDCAAQFVSQRQKLGGNLPGEARRVDKGPAIIGLAWCIGDGAALIARRPDIREAERRLAAAGARVKVATAEMYPRVTLGASGGLIGGSLDAFVTPLITWSFLNPARIKARIAMAEANQQGALAQYDAAWLRAVDRRAKGTPLAG